VEVDVGGRESVVAVVDATTDGVFVWWAHVGLKPGPSMSRLCGAWVLALGEDQTLESLTFKRMVLPTKSGARALKNAGVNPDRLLDPNATVAAATASRDRCQEAFETEQGRRDLSKRLQAPVWPLFPADLDVEHPPPWDVKYEYDHRLESILSIAHWLAALCSRWEELEAQRLARPLLRKLDGNRERALPVVLIGAS
jgi:hypothetical protein